MIIVAKIICAEPCFHARRSNKKICWVIFVLGDTDGWLHHNKIISFKTKKSIVARSEYMNSLKIPSTTHKTIFFSWSATEISKYLLSKRNTRIHYLSSGLQNMLLFLCYGKTSSETSGVSVHSSRDSDIAKHV